MTTTTTTTDQGYRTPGGRDVPASLTLSDEDAAALVRPGATLSPWSPAIGRAAALLCAVLDCSTLTDAAAALTYPGARTALVAAVSAAQHGRVWSDIASDESDGTLAASWVRLAIASAALVRAEDDDQDTAGRPGPSGDECWRDYVARCGRIALVRSLRAAALSGEGEDDRRERATDETPWSRVPDPTDPSVTAPRATRRSRSPGAAVVQPRRSRSEVRRDAIARAAAVTVDAMGGTLDPLSGTGDRQYPWSVVGDPWCPLAAGRGEDDEPHACTPRCFGLGGLHAYSPRQGAAHRTLPAGVAGPVLTTDEGVALVWRPFHAFPVGSAVVRDYLPTDDPTRERGKVRLSWHPTRARQHLTATVGGKRARYTPRTFRGSVVRTPPRTAAAIAQGVRFDDAVVTAYRGVRFVGWVRQDDPTTTRPSRQRAVRIARDRRTLTPQQRAVVTLVLDAVTLTMFDGRPRTAHRDDQGRGWVVTRTPDAVLSLVTPQGVTTPLPTDPRRVAAAVRAAILTP